MNVMLGRTAPQNDAVALSMVEQLVTHWVLARSLAELLARCGRCFPVPTASVSPTAVTAAKPTQAGKATPATKEVIDQLCA